ncbi:MAG: isochorismatase, partial [Alphaproteobacteria bacterium HGW-Alphaproteobacteria-2]
ARTAESCERAILRMAAHGADIVTTEMAIFEWLGDTQSPGFKPVISLVK